MEFREATYPNRFFSSCQPSFAWSSWQRLFFLGLCRARTRCLPLGHTGLECIHQVDHLLWLLVGRSHDFLAFNLGLDQLRQPFVVHIVVLGNVEVFRGRGFDQPFRQVEFIFRTWLSATSSSNSAGFFTWSS